MLFKKRAMVSRMMTRDSASSMCERKRYPWFAIPISARYEPKQGLSRSLSMYFVSHIVIGILNHVSKVDMLSPSVTVKTMPDQSSTRVQNLTIPAR